MEFFSQTTEIHGWALALIFLLVWHLMSRCATLRERSVQWEARAKEWEESSKSKEEEIEAMETLLTKYLLPPPDWIEIYEKEKEADK